MVRRRLDAAELTSWTAGVLGTVATHLQRIGVPTTGEPFVRFFERGPSMDVEAGFPVADRVTPKDEVKLSSLPGGPAVATWHRGHPDHLGAAFEAIDAWLERQAAEATEPPWVVHHPDPEAPPETDTWMSEVIQPYRD